MGKIATEQEATEIGHHGQPVAVLEPTKCCIKTKAINYKCNVAGSYKDNQLVQISDLSTRQDIVLNPNSITLTANVLNRIHFIDVICSDTLLWNITQNMGENATYNLIYDAFDIKGSIGPKSIMIQSCTPKIKGTYQYKVWMLY